jgi:hypothetical protein
MGTSLGTLATYKGMIQGAVSVGPLPQCFPAFAPSANSLIRNGRRALNLALANHTSMTEKLLITAEGAKGVMFVRSWRLQFRPASRIAAHFAHTAHDPTP